MRQPDYLVAFAALWASKDLKEAPAKHYLDLVQAPLLGAKQEPRHSVVVLMAIGWALAPP